MADDDDALVKRIEQEIDVLDRRRTALCNARALLEGTAPLAGARAGRTSVGEDKVAAVRKYIRGKGKVRQADITRELKLNSGTVSTACHTLMLAGEIEPGPKEDRSPTWTYRQ